VTIYCIGRNYAEHAAELNNPVPGEPVVFLKSDAALRACNSPALAFPAESFHHEAELVLRVARDAALGSAGSWDLIDEVALGLDLTRREVQSGLKAKGLPWTTAKSFAGSAVVTDFIPLKSLPDRDAVHFTLKVNGEERQRGDTREMLFKVPVILSFLLSLNELRKGDLIYTGTPKGVGPLKKGDAFELAFTEIGKRFSGTL
jgi:2-keto-4-pentenoate hydratase/2-oxohepta-3-ene-1,7-dioic acid hydratase in catechol pathway